MQHRGILVIQILLTSFFVFTGIYFNYTNQELLTRYTKEDGFIEWMTFLLFLSLFIFLSIHNIWHFFIKKNPLLKLSSGVLIGLQFVFLFGAMEEVSWLQRIADVQSSDFFLQHNRQAETNLHNLRVYGVNINKLIFGKFLFLFALFHNLFLPLIVRKKKNIAKWIDQRGFFIPPLPLCITYIMAAIVIELFIDHARAKEHLEVVGAIHYFLAIFTAYGLGYLKEQALFKNASNFLTYSLLSGYLFMLTFISWILGNISLKDFML